MENKENYFANYNKLVFVKHFSILSGSFFFLTTHFIGNNMYNFKNLRQARAKATGSITDHNYG